MFIALEHRSLNLDWFFRLVTYRGMPSCKFDKYQAEKTVLSLSNISIFHIPLSKIWCWCGNPYPLSVFSIKLPLTFISLPCKNKDVLLYD